jgi:dephospho-CoA kinase
MIIGITGTNGAGKGTVVEYLVKNKGFKHYSVRRYIEAEISKRGMPLDRNSMNIVGNSMRKQHGFDYWDKLIFEDIRKNGDRDVIIESVRNLASAQKLKEDGALIWAVDADKQVRYSRAVLRGSGTDHVSFEEFVAQEDREMTQAAAHDMNTFGIMQIADATLLNNGSKEELHAQIEAALAKPQ